MEEKIKTENSIAQLRREQKTMLAQVDALKKEYALLIEMKGASENALDEQREFMKTLSNQISQERLAWNTERDTGNAEISAKTTALEEDFANKKAILDAKEAEISEIKRQNEVVLHDIRVAEISVNDREMAVEDREKAVKLALSAVEAREVKNEDTIEMFKARASELLEQIKNI